MGFENVWFSRKGPKPSADGVKGKVISGKGTRECRYARQPNGAAVKVGFFGALHVRLGRHEWAPRKAMRGGTGVGAGGAGAGAQRMPSTDLVHWWCPVPPMRSGPPGLDAQTNCRGCVRGGLRCQQRGSRSCACEDGDNLLHRQVIAPG